MIVTVKSISCLSGAVDLPASKSYSIRAFMIALCGGKSRIINPSLCDDAQAAIAVAKNLGAKILEQKNNTWFVSAKKKKSRLSQINVKESGTTLRFLLPLLPLHGSKANVIGEGTLRGRPNHLLTRVLRSCGVSIRGKGPNESVPITMLGGQFQGGRIQIDGSLSSQFISALLIACPLLSENTQLIIKGSQIVSSDYITMTCQVLKKSGVKIDRVNQRSYKIRGKQRFKGLGKFIVPSDYGLAAFLMAAAALFPSDIVLNGHLSDTLIQADRRILYFLRKMGGKFSKNKRSLKIKGPFSLKGGSFSLKDCPDLVPIMSVLALFAKGKTRLYDIQHARVKESNRITDLRKELIKIGAKVSEKSNELTIHPCSEYKRDVLLDPHHDHRLAMAFCVLGLKVGVRVKDIECVSKSYPDFLKDFSGIGGNILKGQRARNS